MEMLMDVVQGAAVGMLMRMKAMEVAIALLDATEFPHECRNTPRSQENADDHVAEDPEVEPGDRIEEPSLEIEQADKDLQQFDRSDQQRHRDRQAGDRDVVENFPQRIHEGPSCMPWTSARNPWCPSPTCR